MEGRERLITVMKGEIPDRVPVSPFVQEEFLSYFYPDDNVDRVKSAVNCAEYFDFEVMTRHRLFSDYPHFLCKSFPNWEVSFKNYRESGNYYEVFQIKTPLKTLKQIEARPDSAYITSYMPTTIKCLIEDESDLESFVKYMPAIDTKTVNEMRDFASWAKKYIGNRGVSAPWGLSVYNLAARLRNIEKLLIDPYINEDFYVEFMNKLTEICIEYNCELANANKDVISYTGNIANSGLIGKDFFNSFILPYEKKVVNAIHQAGSFTLYHNCGRAEILQDSYIEMGMTAWETISEEPRGDNDLARAKRNIGDKITLVGNLDQIDFLKKATTDEVYEKVEKMMEIAKPKGRYIFSCSDFLERGTPIENVKAMIDAAKLFGRY